jgi:translation initiation factor IF-2
VEGTVNLHGMDLAETKVVWPGAQWHSLQQQHRPVLVLVLITSLTTDCPPAVSYSIYSFERFLPTITPTERSSHRFAACRKRQLRQRIRELQLAGFKSHTNSERKAMLQQSMQLEEEQLKQQAAGTQQATASDAADAAAADDESARAAVAADPDEGAAAAAAALPPDAPVITFVIKADVQGSAEAVRDAVTAAAAGKVHLKVVYCGVGPVTASDVHLAAATGARLVAFNLRPPAADVDAALKTSKVEVLQHRVIYHLLDEVESCIAEAESGVAGGQGSLAEQVLGSATVLQVFPLLQNRKEVGKVAGCRVQEGSLQVASGVVFRVLRDGEVVFEGPCSNLRQHKNDVTAVGKAAECGVVLDEGRFGGYQPGDVVQCVQQRTVRG